MLSDAQKTIDDWDRWLRNNAAVHQWTGVYMGYQTALQIWDEFLAKRKKDASSD